MIFCVESETNADFPFDVSELFERVAAKTLANENCPFEVAIDLLLTDDEGIRRLNATHRGQDRPTDVLSFPALTFEKAGAFCAAQKDDPANIDPATGAVWLGDIALNCDRVRTQAKEYGHSEEREFAFLVAHSVLHLCGYDHETKEEAQEMETRQEDALRALGIAREAKANG